MTTKLVGYPSPAEQVAEAKATGKPVGILGAGPSGLLAAHAVARAGLEPILFDKFVQAPPLQAGVYLHRHIPGVSSEEPNGQVEFACCGDAAVYAKKVYGEDAEGSSWERFVGAEPQPAWEFNDVMKRLWSRYGHNVRHRQISARTLDPLMDACAMVISTIPACFLCDGSHDFDGASIWISQGALPVGVSLPSANAYCYSGRLNDAWSRCGRLFGQCWIEYPSYTPGAVSGTKPIATDCDCRPIIIRAGRFGQWKRGVLLTDVFDEITELCEGADALL